MAIVVDKSTMATLVAERAALFEHNFHVHQVIAFWLMLAFILVLWSGLHARKKNTGGEHRVATGFIGCILVVTLFVLTWIDLRIEEKEFNRAPQTYVIKHLR